MTRQEAMDALDLIPDMIANCADCHEVYEALDMAIEALENSQNCVKCIHYYETEDECGVHSHCEQESKRGKWEKKEHLVPLPWDCSPMNPDNYDSDTHSEYEWYWHCSECDYEADRCFRSLWKYCPNCGARMENDGK